MDEIGNSLDKTSSVPPEIEKIVQEFEKAFFDIPFENSAFQNVHFVIQQQMTPARAYRAIGLRMSAKIRALQEAYFDRQAEEIDIAELEAKRQDPRINQFERQRAELEIRRKMSHRSYTDKLINDAIVEIQTLDAELKKLPTYNREQFESEERLHFQIRLGHQMRGLTGAAESLMAMAQPVSNPSVIAQLQSIQELGKQMQTSSGDHKTTESAGEK